MQSMREGGKGVDNTGTAWHGLLAQQGLMHVVSLHVKPIVCLLLAAAAWAF